MMGLVLNPFCKISADIKKLRVSYEYMTQSIIIALLPSSWQQCSCCLLMGLMSHQYGNSHMLEHMAAGTAKNELPQP